MTEPTFDHERLDVYRISMLAMLIQHTRKLSEGSIEDEYQYRFTEYEYRTPYLTFTHPSAPGAIE